MNNRVFGAIGVLAGGAIVVHWWLARAAADATSAARVADASDYQVGYAAGQAYLAVFGAVLFVSGLVALFNKRK